MINPRFLLIALALFCAGPARLHAQIISTICGTGTGGYSGDGGMATAAQINGLDIATDAAGNIYYADYYNYRIRKIDPTGIITTICGDGVYGYSGDGGPATAAQMGSAWGVTLDAAGSIYFCDGGHHVVRKIDPSGIITTVAGHGGPGPSGDGGPATDAGIMGPTKVAFDAAGNMYIVDMSSDNVRKVNTSGIISTFAGYIAAGGGFAGDGGPASAALLQNPVWVSVGPSGNIYIADVGNSRIRMVNPAGIISTIVGYGVDGFTGDGGPASAARINNPGAVIEDAAGNVFFSDGANHRVRRIDPWGYIATVAGTGVAGYAGDGLTSTAAELNYPEGLAFNCFGDLLVAESSNHTIRKIGYATGTIVGDSLLCMATPVVLVDTPSGIVGTWSSSNPSVASINSTGDVMPVSLGTAVIRYTITAACGSEAATKQVTVIALPDPGVVSGMDTVCVGITTTLVTTGTGGTWSSASTGIATVGTAGIVMGVAGGTSVISYTVSNVCGTVAATDTVVVKPLANVGTITGPANVCEGYFITLINTATGGTWSASNANATVSTTGVVTGVNPGTVTISYTNSNDCGTLSSVKLVTVLPASACLTGVSQTGNDDYIKLYPSPSAGVVNLNLTSGVEEIKVLVYNYLGQIIATFNFDDNLSDHKLDLSGIPSGCYMVELQIGLHTYRKIITLAR